MSDLLSRLLIVDDDPQITAGLAALLEDDWQVRVASTGREAIVAFGEFSPDVVLLDVSLPDTTGIDLLHQLKMYSETTAVIMMSGGGSVDRVIESMKLGAETFLQKPFDYDTLLATLETVRRMISTRRELLALKRNEAGQVDRIPGISPSVQHLNSILPQIARAPSPVLIEGESGTGKGVMARLIHNRSPRARAPFVDLNCAGLSKELLESELFGHERGAFTNATNTKPGLFEIAGEGTLFLDEIGEMETTVQARLLKALEEKRFRRVGGIRDLRADFRLIAATNRDLGSEVAAGRFRSDLYYRLNVVRLRMPPLRERMEDLPILVQELLRPLAKEMGRAVPKVSANAMKKLERYPWPGNVRELRNVLERALLTLAEDQVRSEDLIIEGGTPQLASSADGLPTEEWQIRPLDDLIARYVAAAVEATGGNMRKAARALQISPSTLYARLK
ncbi:MAG: sigma-54-dependent Fis family transcriptional regulator [Acidobacteria bacterium]|nr:sigma-54-dependent Fis family transcriptional regulator [Acidobacteriota bacterium]MBV9478009.1 sigma-54-dependent Fis family transcriptional regulator [Acidobacteriota bacterium]